MLLLFKPLLSIMKQLLMKCIATANDLTLQMRCCNTMIPKRDYFTLQAFVLKTLLPEKMIFLIMSFPLQTF